MAGSERCNAVEKVKFSNDPERLKIPCGATVRVGAGVDVSSSVIDHDEEVASADAGSCVIAHE